MQVFSDFNKVHIHKDEEIFSLIYFGSKKACKTEAEAREAAELLKAFFEAKQRRENIRFIEVGEYEYRIKEARREGYNDGLTAAREIAEGKKEIDAMTGKGEADPMEVARMAAWIFAHNAQTMTERDAVKSAAKIIELSKRNDL